MRNPLQTINTDAAKISLLDTGIVCLEFSTNQVTIDGNLAMQILVSRQTLKTESIRQLVFVDLTSNPVPDKDARYLAKTEEMNNSTEAMAMLTDNTFNKLLGNFFAGISKGQYPVKLFTNEQEAMDWLLSHHN